MKKGILMLTMLSLFFATPMFAQSITLKCTYTGVDGSVVMDGISGFKAIKKTNTILQVINPGCGGTIAYEGNMGATILDIKMNVRASDKTIVVAVMTASAVKLVVLAPFGGTYTAVTNSFNAPMGTTFQSMLASKAPYGLSFIMKASNGTNAAGKIQFSGANTHDVILTQPGATYYGIVSDNTYHYLVYSVTSGVYTGTYIERRNDDASMTPDGYYGIDTATYGYVSTDYHQNTGDIIVYLKSPGGTLIKKTVNKASFMTFYTATLSQTIGSTTNGDAALYVNNGISIFGNKAVSHSTNNTGAITVGGSAFFTSGYNTFRATDVGSNHFTWSGYSSDGKIRVGLWDGYLHELSSLTISDGSSNTRNGEYQLNDSTYIIYGSSLVGGITKAKEWIVNIPSSGSTTTGSPFIEPEPQNNLLRFWPNPVTTTITIAPGLDIREVVITDMAGRVVQHCCAYQMDLSDLAAGVYIIRYGTQTSKFIKQ